MYSNGLRESRISGFPLLVESLSIIPTVRSAEEIVSGHLPQRHPPALPHSPLIPPEKNSGGHGLLQKCREFWGILGALRGQWKQDGRESMGRMGLQMV